MIPSSTYCGYLVQVDNLLPLRGNLPEPENSVLDALFGVSPTRSAKSYGEVLGLISGFQKVDFIRNGTILVYPDTHPCSEGIYIRGTFPLPTKYHSHSGEAKFFTYGTLSEDFNSFRNSFIKWAKHAGLEHKLNEITETSPFIEVEDTHVKYWRDLFLLLQSGSGLVLH